MIKIELQFETGAEARQALCDLLGMNLTAIVKASDLTNLVINTQHLPEKISEPKMEIVKEEKPAEEIIVPGKKRRTKAEIEAEKTGTTITPGNESSGTVLNETDIQEGNDAAETQAQDNKEAIAVTSTMLQEKAVELIRGGKKDKVVAVIKQFGADSISQADKNPLKVETYAAVMDELNKIV